MQTAPAPVIESSLTITNNPKLTELGAFTKLSGVNLADQHLEQLGTRRAAKRRPSGAASTTPAPRPSHANNGTSCSVRPYCFADTNNNCPYASVTN